MPNFIKRLESTVHTDYSSQLIVVTLLDRKNNEAFRFEYNIRDVQSVCDWPSNVPSYCVERAIESLKAAWSPQP